MKIIDKNHLLSEDQVTLLQESALIDFSLGIYNSLDDILSSLNVDVIIEPGVKNHKAPSKLFFRLLDYWGRKFSDNNRCDVNYRKLDEIFKSLNFNYDLLLGCYKPENNIVILYPEAMKTIEDGSKMDELLVSVLAHETMHAYFNRPGHEKFPYAYFVEEPLAEFGMLLYLEKTKSPYINYVYDFVKSKKSCYRYGAAIFDDYKDGEIKLRDYLKNYKFRLADGEFALITEEPWIEIPKSSRKIRLSKSRYTLSIQCQKALWLELYDKDKKTISSNLTARFEQGNIVGDLAMGLLGPYVDVTVKTGSGSLDLDSMIQRTKDCLDNDVENICEASFAFDDYCLASHYCAVDILHKNGSAYDIYEVKSSSDDGLNEKNSDEYLKKYICDIAYQKWVLQKCGINVGSCFLIRINSEYTRKDTLSIADLFCIKNMDKYVNDEYDRVEQNVEKAIQTLICPSEPSVSIGLQCSNPYECLFKNYCFKDVPKPSVLDLYKMKKEIRWDFYNEGKKLFSDLTDEDLGNSVFRHNQVKGVPYINKKEILKFLKTLSYPLYFLDFETMMFAVPPYKNLKPYQQIPFQYSLHYRTSYDGTIFHTEYLAESDKDPRREIAERLCSDIPKNVCVLAYNKTFECGRLKELAALFPDLAKHLLCIEKNIKDLIDPFKAGHYYLPAMGGSCSIKSVLPALFPNDASFDYHNLSGGVQNGGDAMTIFPLIKNMSEPQKTQTRKALLDYCKLDTLAMVKILEKLYDEV